MPRRTKYAVKKWLSDVYKRQKLDKAMNRYLDAVKKAGQDLHSIMIVQHGNVIAEEWMGEGMVGNFHLNLSYQNFIWQRKLCSRCLIEV